MSLTSCFLRLFRQGGGYNEKCEVNHIFGIVPQLSCRRLRASFSAWFSSRAQHFPALNFLCAHLLNEFLYGAPFTALTSFKLTRACALSRLRRTAGHGAFSFAVSLPCRNTSEDKHGHCRRYAGLSLNPGALNPDDFTPAVAVFPAVPSVLRGLMFALRVLLKAQVRHSQIPIVFLLPKVTKDPS